MDATTTATTKAKSDRLWNSLNKLYKRTKNLKTVQFRVHKLNIAFFVRFSIHSLIYYFNGLIFLSIFCEKIFLCILKYAKASRLIAVAFINKSITIVVVRDRRQWRLLLKCLPSLSFTTNSTVIRSLFGKCNDIFMDDIAFDRNTNKIWVTLDFLAVLSFFCIFFAMNWRMGVHRLNRANSVCKFRLSMAIMQLHNALWVA